jgi:hypothetical protein
MKKVFILFSIAVFFLILSIGIVDSVITLTNDVNNHLWLSLVGRWQSSESAYYEIEFNPDGTFNEYYYGVKRGFGNYQAYGRSIVLNYDLSSCRRESGNDCTVHMEFHINMKTITLINNEKRTLFNKVLANK